MTFSLSFLRYINILLHSYAQPRVLYPLLYSVVSPSPPPAHITRLRRQPASRVLVPLFALVCSHLILSKGWLTFMIRTDSHCVYQDGAAFRDQDWSSPPGPRLSSIPLNRMEFHSLTTTDPHRMIGIEFLLNRIEPLPPSLLFY
jgi:hypothetical protein